MAVSSDSGSLLNTRFGWGPMPGRDNHLHRRAGAILVHPHKVGRPPAGVVARGTGREHRLSSGTVTDQPPGLASEILVERMRMPDLRRDGLATVRATSAQRRVPLCSARAALSWQEACPDLIAPKAGAPAGAAARWTVGRWASRDVPRLWRQQLAAHQVGVGPREQAEGARQVLGDAAIPDLGNPPQLLHHVERVLAPSASPRPRPIDGAPADVLRQRRQIAVARAPFLRKLTEVQRPFSALYLGFAFRKESPRAPTSSPTSP
jgi:hypothetical protein